MNTANKLTMLRVILIPVYLVVLYLGFAGSLYVALAVFIIASITDFVDGYVARHYNQVTDFGKFMDPLADKVLVIAREFAVSGLRMVAVDNGRVIAAAWSGKVKTFATMVCLILMHLPIWNWLNWVCIAIIAATTLYSGVEYFVKNKDVLNTHK